MRGDTNAPPQRRWHAAKQNAVGHGLARAELHAMAKERRVSRTVLLVTAATSTVLDEMPPECVATSDAQTRRRAPQRAKELPVAPT